MTTTKPLHSISRTQQKGKGLVSALRGKQNPTPPKKETVLTKLFVLDTNVFLSDPYSMYKFAENDIYIPAIVLTEIDNHKKGNDDTARNSREFSRTLKGALSKNQGNIRDGILLKDISKNQATGRLFLQTDDIVIEKDITKADSKIIAVAEALTKKFDNKYIVILVTKDHNMFIEAKAKGLRVEDYFHDVVIQDIDLLYPGFTAPPARFWDKIENFSQTRVGIHTRYKTPHELAVPLLHNEFIFDDRDISVKKNLRVVGKDGKITEFESITDYTIQKNSVLGITARNREQNFAFNLLMDKDVDFITILGKAGTGKTLLTLAAAIYLVGNGTYSDIRLTRALITAGEDIGFLPGTEREKMDPWMGALHDNLEVLGKAGVASDSKKSGHSMSHSHTNTIKEMELREKIKELTDLISVKTIGFMRGRTFLNKFVIVDEAQNLTPKQAKTLVTRAGPGTKMVFLGNLAQIDAPYMTEGSSGLTHTVERFKGWKHGGHLILPTGERSRLASFGEEVL